MKRLHRFFAILFCLVLLAAPMRAFADEWDDDPEDESETEIVTQTPRSTTSPAAAQSTTAIAYTPTAPTPTGTTTAKSLSFDPPLVKITRDDLASKPKTGDTFTMTVVFRNYSSEVALHAGLAAFEPSEGLVLAENSASKVVPPIKPNTPGIVKIRLRVAKDAASANQSVAVTYTYSYDTPEGLQQAEAAEKLLVTVVPAASATEKDASASATPNIIVTGYQYGGTIAAGDTFDLQLVFQNTSKKLAAENIVMSVEVGDGLTITSASNTYYYDSLGAGKSRSQSIPMRVAVNADPDGARIDISFRYEYVDNGTRSSASASERLSVPIYIPDRFTVSAPEMDLIGVQNEELSVSLPYINKSRVEVSNVSARLIFDEAAVFCEQPRVNLGNFEPGKSGTIDFYFTPLEAGSGCVTVEITYEDELTQEKQLRVEVPYSADEAYFDPGMDEPTDFPEDTPNAFAWLRFVIPAAALVIVLPAVLLLVRRHRKKKAAEPSIDFDWTSPQEVESHEDR